MAKKPTAAPPADARRMHALMTGQPNVGLPPAKTPRAQPAKG